MIGHDLGLITINVAEADSPFREKTRIAQLTLVASEHLGKRVAMEVKKGDRVLIGKYSGTEVKIDGVDHVIVREDEILAILS